MNRKQRRAQAKAAEPAPKPPSAQVMAAFQAAVEHHQAGRLDEAERIYRQVLAADPRDADARHLLGVIANQRGRHEAAAELIGQAIAITPDFALFHVNLGVAYRSLGRLEDALAAFRAAQRLDPNMANAYAYFGSTLNVLRRYTEAVPAFVAALRLAPDSAEAWCDLGITLCHLKRLDDAVKAFQSSLNLNPRNVQTLSNLGIALKDLGRAREAIAMFDRAIALNPSAAEVHNNRGNALAALGLLDEAIAAFDRCIGVDPRFAMAHVHRSFAMLLQGDLPGGFRRLEWRKANWPPPHPRLAGPQWSGEDKLQGSTLFISCEDGLGDTIQFCRYAALAADRAARVILSAQPPLLTLLAGLDPRIELIADGHIPADFDEHIPLFSLPLAFGTTLETIPAAPAYLRADPDKAKAWAERLGAGARPRVGLAWSGNPGHANDANRSIPLADLAPLLNADVDWVGLQPEVREGDRPALSARGGLRMFGEELRDFSDTAALIDALDLVIAVDTSVAHLAAALGKPTWVLLPFTPDWRWLLGREDSPWYPSVRLLRQPAPRAWASVIARARQQLDQHFSQA